MAEILLKVYKLLVWLCIIELGYRTYDIQMAVEWDQNETLTK